MTWRHPSERHSWFKTTFRAGTRARAEAEREEATTGKQVPASPVPSRSVSSKPVAENWDIVPDHFDDSKAGPAEVSWDGGEPGTPPVVGGASSINFDVPENWDIVPDHFDDEVVAKAGPAAIPGRAPRGASGTSDETGPAEGVEPGQGRCVDGASITADEFERAYAQRSGVTVEWLRFVGRVVLPCNCGSDDCEGWQSASSDDADFDHFTSHAWDGDLTYTSTDPNYTASQMWADAQKQKDTP